MTPVYGAPASLLTFVSTMATGEVCASAAHTARITSIGVFICRAPLINFRSTAAGLSRPAATRPA
jgi:hypothetical protein